MKTWSMPGIYYSIYFGKRCHKQHWRSCKKETQMRSNSWIATFKPFKCLLFIVQRELLSFTCFPITNWATQCSFALTTVLSRLMKVRMDYWHTYSAGRALAVKSACSCGKQADTYSNIYMGKWGHVCIRLFGGYFCLNQVITFVLQM